MRESSTSRKSVAQSSAAVAAITSVALTGGARADEVTINGTGGSDTILVWITEDGVHKSQLNDDDPKTHQGVTKFVINGLGGNDTIDGQRGTGVLGETAVEVPMEVHGGAGHDTIRGGHKADELNGDGGNDNIYGYDGHDTINGGPGDDLLSGEAGRDTINGGDGNDRCFGGPGGDWVNGDGGEDKLFGGDGVDRMNGGAGDDLVVGGADNDKLHGNAGKDEIWGDFHDCGLCAAFGDGEDQIWGDDDDDTIYGCGRFDEIQGGPGKDRIWGDDHADHISGNEGGDIIYGGKFGDTIHGNEGNDAIFGEEGADGLDGHEGDDRIFGGPEADSIFGGPGNDKLFGQGAVETFLRGEDGDDLVVGGAGVDPTDGGAHLMADTCAECPPDACANCEILLPGIAEVGICDPVTASFDPETGVVWLEADFVDWIANGHAVQEANMITGLDLEAERVVSGIEMLNSKGVLPTLRGLRDPDPVLGTAVDLWPVQLLEQDPEGRFIFSDGMIELISPHHGPLLQSRLINVMVDPHTMMFSAELDELFINFGVESGILAELQRAYEGGARLDMWILDVPATMQLLEDTAWFSEAGTATGCGEIECASFNQFVNDGSPFDATTEVLGVTIRKGSAGDRRKRLLRDSDGDAIEIAPQHVLDPAVDRWITDTRVRLRAHTPDVSRLDLAVTVGVDIGTVRRTRIYLRNWDAGAWTLIDNYTQPESDTRKAYLDIPQPDSFVRDSDGLIRVRVVTTERVSTAPEGYVARIDRVEVFAQ